ncbi:CD1871A family CXXC motif-containing protein [Tissierella praeacuta]|nr:CD1871A family CXXC motif-containing protein [Tissierella praeacuta]
MLIVTAIAFVGLGVYRGEVETVFAKAIRLCLECVGIG